MTKLEAIETILKDSKSSKITPASLKRIQRAGKALGLDQDEQTRLEQVLEFRNSNGELHSYLLTK
jgi:hypothetical protein